MKRIAIHSVPRSGSSWLAQIFNSSPNVIYKFQPLFSYALKSFIDEKSSKQDIDAFFDKLAETKDDFIDQKLQIDNGNYPKFIKNNPQFICYKEVRYHYIIENLLQKNRDIKIVGIVRSPFAVISSWLKAPKEFRKELGWNEIKEWRYAPKKNDTKKEEYNGYEKWKEIATLFLDLQNKFPDNFYLLKYSDLLASPEKIVTEIFSFCEITYSSQTKNFIKQSISTQKSDAYSVFRNKTIKKDIEYKKNLNPIIQKEIFEDIKDTKFEQFL